jgi:hypothetical protein
LAVNLEGLASQAQRLTHEQQALLGLLVAWVFSPLLDLDPSEHGRHRRDVCLGALDEALTHFHDVGAMKQLQERVVRSEELDRDEEPRELPARYRLDFMAMLYYAILSLTEQSSGRTRMAFGGRGGRTPKVLRRPDPGRLAPGHVPGHPMASCLNRCRGAIDIGKRYGTIPESWDMDGALAEIVAGPQLTSTRGAESFPALQEVLRPPYEALAAVVASRVNSERLPSQVQRLTYEQQALLGLLLVWVLSPLLEVDRSEHGRYRRDVCLRALDEAVRHFHDLGEMKQLEERVEHSEDVDRDEEPDELPALYRHDVMVTLSYAIQTLTGRSSQAMAWCLQRAEETIDLGKNHDTIPVSWDVYGPLLEIVAGPQLTSARGAESFPALQRALRPAFDALAAAAEKPDL